MLKKYKLKGHIDKAVIVEAVVLFFLCLAMTYLFYVSYLNEDNCNYAVEEMHAYDNQLFEGNISAAGSEYSPRYIANGFMVLLMKAVGGSWLDAAVILIHINYILYAAAAACMALKITKRDRLLAGIIISICLMRGSLISLGFTMAGAEDVFLGTGVAFGLIGIACVIGERKQWSLAWIFLAVSELMHVHEGLWTGAVAGLIWLTLCIADKKIDWRALRTFPIYIISLFLVVVPSLTHTAEVNEKLFNDIYVFIRTPHHLLVSSWGRNLIIASAVLLFMAAIVKIRLALKKVKSEKRRELMLTAAMGILWLALLAVQYIFTEVIANSTIVTMYLTKCFKYITLLGVLAYLEAGFKGIEDKRYLQGTALISIPLLCVGPDKRSLILVIVLFLIAMVLMHFKTEQGSASAENFPGDKFKILTYVFILWLVNRYCKGYQYVFLVYGFILFYQFILPYIRVSRAVWGAMAAVLVITVTAAFDGTVFRISKYGFHFISGEEYVKNAVGGELYALAEEFKTATDTQETFLANPYDARANYFQLISQRNCYALWKNIPSAKNVIIDWYGRVADTAKVTTCSAEELRELMCDIKIEYVLVTQDRYPVLDESEIFEQVVGNDELAVYRLRQKLW